MKEPVREAETSTEATVATPADEADSALRKALAQGIDRMRTTSCASPAVSNAAAGFWRRLPTPAATRSEFDCNAGEQDRAAAS